MKGPLENPWPWGIAGGLGVVVAVNAFMIHIALSHPSIPASRDHYGESQHWNDVQAERGRSQALGWQVELQPCGELSADGCPLVLHVRDHAGAVTGLRGTITAQRADDPRLDREAEVSASGEGGRYEARLSLAQPGLYALSIRLEGGPAPWVDARRIQVARSERGAP